MQTQTYYIPEAKCPHCQHLVNAVSGKNPPGRLPKSGDCCVCFNCGSVLFFNDSEVHLGTQGDLETMPGFVRQAIELASGKPTVARLPDKQPSGLDHKTKTIALAGGKIAGGLLKGMSLRNRMNLVTRFLDIMVSEVPDEEWQRMMAYEPQHCGAEGCECHKRKLATIHALKLLRRE